ncbi:hypothetical protein ACWGJ2_22320 [Streptomyces sp. NPDC054796]
MKRKEVIRSLLTEGLDDWIPVDRLIDLARESSTGGSRDFKEEFAEILSCLLDDGLVIVGDLEEKGVSSWGSDNAEILARVVHDLDEANWSPQGGSCWIANTERGDRLVS